jgi:hypothetical protein
MLKEFWSCDPNKDENLPNFMKRKHPRRRKARSSIPPQIEDCPAKALSGRDSAALQRTVWFCCRV